MTAEVVVMNKQGIAMAADSAITSGRGGVQKVYNTANKLFSISSEHPVGIMVYGAASFMEVPWEIIIKMYREYLGNQKFAHLEDYMKNFLEFLQQDKRINNETVEDIIIYRIFSDHMKRLVKDVEGKIAIEKDNEIEVSAEKVTKWLVENVEKNIKSYKNEEIAFLKLDYNAFKKKFGPVIKEVIDELIRYEIPGHVTELFYELAFEAAKKDYFSIGSTGFVFGGFGEEQIFPQVFNYRLEGFIFGQLKYKKLKEKQITYTSEGNEGTASIMPFAQREMVDSFLGGLEPNMEDVIFSIISKVLIEYPKQIQKHLSIEFTKEEVKDLTNMGREIHKSAIEAVQEYQQSNYIEPLLGVVRALPKEELADMAEMLISLTSFKRRVTRATESVGPPIDVAIITSGDGFVWMKRKNYVNAEINKRL